MLGQAVRRLPQDVVLHQDQTSSTATAAAIPRVVLSLWDYGGQPIFHCLHPLFLSRYGIYFVVFNLVRMALSGDGERVECVKDLRFWLSSVAVHGRGAPVILVGTHKDQVTSHFPVWPFPSQFLVLFPLAASHSLSSYTLTADPGGGSATVVPGDVGGAVRGVGGD